MTESNLLFIILSAAVTLLIILSGAALYLRAQNKNGKHSYEAQLNDLINYDNDEVTPQQPKVTLITRWNQYWGKLFSDLGVTGYNDDETKAGRNVLLGVFILIGALYLFFKNFPLAVVIAAVITYTVSAFMRSRASKKTDEISAQLPEFLFMLKANIQAHETPERALLKIVDSTPSPLHDDLIIVKQKLLANATFKEALQDLSARTTSRDLQFLCACMIQASGTGSTIEPQINTIQKILEDRRKVTEEINRSLKGARPAMIISSIIIPGFFIYAEMVDPNARSFWFKQPISYIILVLVVIIYGFGMWMVKKFVDDIRNL